MNNKTLSTPKVEHQLLLKDAINLPPRQRLELLLKAEKYPISNKKTSAKKQIYEMIDFYNLCCLMLAQYFPNGQAEHNFLLLNFVALQENSQSIITEKLAEALKLLRRYEALESRITAIQMLFYQYQYSFPELYESLNLEDIATKSISDLLQEAKQLMNNNPKLVEEILNRWELLS